MAIPPGVRVVTINLVPPVGVSSTHMNVEALATVPVRWASTNTPIAEMIERGPGFSLLLPATDQTGFVTTHGSNFQGWEYLITISGRIRDQFFSESTLLSVPRAREVIDLAVLTPPDPPGGIPGGHDQTGTYAQLARNPEALFEGQVDRDDNGAPVRANIVWPDGVQGIYQVMSVSYDFPGAVDAYYVTYGSPPVKTYTQPPVTRDPRTGAIAILPAVIES